ncbi:gamma-glutamylcyclotransferase [Synechococcus sp. RSCCF101]|uniref:gamma-glutamylcyclotransferase family protein n=1 Tax=Synechococcus sp. RSCCF101 TaxID=2511069 RepID=UPI001246DF69|nr:gamma-glutamylcyclotransferase family protein [Synechococcus sp. RSCCF101]QEY31104.1 gamma-glutamylcyclotransferase [Synechococcus sp. RSCCF101]
MADPAAPSPESGEDADALFVYGSLMCADIFERVSGVPARLEPAELPGYRRWSVRGEDYPAIVPDPPAVVAGRLVRALPAAAWPRLDRFEGELYRRCSVRVQLPGGRALPAQAYVLDPAERHRLDAPHWSFEAFLDGGKQRFLARYGGFADEAQPSSRQARPNT